MTAVSGDLIEFGSFGDATVETRLVGTRVRLTDGSVEVEVPDWKQVSDEVPQVGDRFEFTLNPISEKRYRKLKDAAS